MCIARSWHACCVHSNTAQPAEHAVHVPTMRRMQTSCLLATQQCIHDVNAEAAFPLSGARTPLIVLCLLVLCQSDAFVMTN